MPESSLLILNFASWIFLIAHTFCSISTVTVLVHSIITSQLGSFSRLLKGFQESVLAFLWSILPRRARVINLQYKPEYITSPSPTNQRNTDTDTDTHTRTHTHTHKKPLKASVVSCRIKTKLLTVYEGSDMTWLLTFSSSFILLFSAWHTMSFCPFPKPRPPAC